jgi:plastocyanin
MKIAAAFSVLLLSVVCFVVGSSSAGAAPHQVTIANTAFTPSTMTVGLGDTVTWTDLQQDVTHTVTSNQGFWPEATLHLNDTFSPPGAFKNAGGYAYHCSIHQSMTGLIRVGLAATGSPSSGWEVRWSSLAHRPTNRSFDVQIKRPGSNSFTSFRSGVSKLSATFDPAQSGSYQFRARTRIVSSGAVTAWSPVRTLSIS